MLWFKHWLSSAPSAGTRRAIAIAAIAAAAFIALPSEPGSTRQPADLTMSLAGSRLSAFVRAGHPAAACGRPATATTLGEGSDAQLLVDNRIVGEAIVSNRRSGPRSACHLEATFPVHDAGTNYEVRFYPTAANGVPTLMGRTTARALLRGWRHRHGGQVRVKSVDPRTGDGEGDTTPTTTTTTGPAAPVVAPSTTSTTSTTVPATTTGPPPSNAPTTSTTSAPTTTGPRTSTTTTTTTTTATTTTTPTTTTTRPTPTTRPAPPPVTSPPRGGTATVDPTYGLPLEPAAYGPAPGQPARVPYTGPSNVPDGAVLANVVVTGGLTVGSNVTLRNVEFRAPSAWTWQQRNSFVTQSRGAHGLVVEDSIFNGADANGVPVVYDAIAGWTGDVTLRRCDVTKVGNAIEFGSGVVEGCSLHDLWQAGPASGWHSDGIQSNGGGPITVRDNYIAMGRPPAGYWSQTSAVGMWADLGDLDHVLVTHNVIERLGGFVFYNGVTNNSRFAVTNVRFEQNVIRKAGGLPSDYGTFYSPALGAQSGNVYDDGSRA